MISLVCRGTWEFPHRKVMVYGYDGPLPPSVEHISNAHLELRCTRCGYGPRVSAAELSALLMIAAAQGGVFNISAAKSVVSSPEAATAIPDVVRKALLEPVDVPISGVVFAVYRLWGRDDRCLYVGQTARVHPILRIMNHSLKPWWADVARADYIDVTGLLCDRADAPAQLNRIEMWQIRQLDPVHNKIRA